MYEICLSNRAQKQLKEIKLVDRKLFNDILERLYFLQNNNWKGGSRVKKLEGVNLWEARLNQADRVLFLPDNDTLFIQYVYLEHDNVNRKARSIKPSKNGIEWREIEEIIPVSIEKIIQSVLYEVPTFTYHRLELEDYIRLSETEDISDIALKVRLLPHQQEAVDVALPAIITGQAGSGKSTVLLYKILNYLLNHMHEEPVVLFVTKNNRLLNDLVNQYKHLINGHECENYLQKSLFFETIETRTSNAIVDTYSKYIDYEIFYELYSKYSLGNFNFRTVSPQNLYFEILGIICAPLLKRLPSLTREQYLILPVYEAPTFVQRREEIYRFYIWYSEYKKKNNAYDSIDKMIAIEPINSQKYDFIVIDEVQDLHLGEIAFIFEHLDTNGTYLMAGDERQAIIYENFSWSSLKRYLYQSLGYTPSELFELNENFRNPKPIAELSDSIFQHAFEIGINELNYKKSYAIREGECAYHIDTENFEFLSVLSENSIVIIGKKDQEQDVVNTCNSHNVPIPIILTVQESKGMEFDVVWLWEVAKNLLEPFNKNKMNLDEIHIRQSLIQSFKQLYVSVTRTVRYLFIIENERTFWSNIFKPVNSLSYTELIDLIPTTSENQLTRVIQHLFYEQQYNRCFKLLQRFKEMPDELLDIYIRVKGLYLQENGKYLEAAVYYESHNWIKESVQCYEEIKDYKAISILLTKYLRNKAIIDDEFKELSLLRDSTKIRRLDQEGNWEAAARLCLRNGRVIEAFNRVTKIENSLLLAQIIEIIIENNFPSVFIKKVAAYLKNTSHKQLYLEILKKI